jgi:hypothetical protein
VSHDGRTHPARVVAWSEKDAVAIVEVPTALGVESLALERHRPAVGDRITLLGYPLASSVDEDEVDIGRAVPRFGAVSRSDERISVDIRAAHGDSGGPVVSAKGAVIGMLVVRPTGIQPTFDTTPAERVHALVDRIGKQGEFEPEPDVHASGYGGLFVTPIASNGLRGAGMDGGYRHDWMVAGLLLGAWQSDLRLSDGGAYTARERISLELHAGTQFQLFRRVGLFIMSGIAFNGQARSTVREDASGALVKERAGEANIRGLAILGTVGGFFFSRYHVQFPDPEIRFDLGLVWGR